jgi:hypothetical protein
MENNLEPANKYLSEASMLFSRGSEQWMLEPDDIPLYLMANVQDRLGNVKGATSYKSDAMEYASSRFGYHGRGWLPLAYNYLGQRRFVTAEWFLEMADTGDTTDSRTLNIIVNAYRKLAILDAAYSHAERAEKIRRAVGDSPWWCLARMARVRYDCHDLRPAEKLLREALNDLLTAEAEPFHEIWIRWELANILKQIDKQQEAAEQFAEVATALRQVHKTGGRVYSGVTDEILLAISLLETGKQEDSAKILSAIGEDDNGVLAGIQMAKGIFYEQKDDITSAIDAYKIAATRRELGGETTYVAWVEPRLLQLMLKNHDAAQACEFFTNLLAKRGEVLPNRHPDLAFTRVLLAKAIIAEGTHLARADTLLDEADEILSLHEYAPQETRQEISQLRQRLRD